MPGVRDIIALNIKVNLRNCNKDLPDLSAPEVATIDVINNSLGISRVVHKHKSKAFGKSGLISCDDNFIDATSSVWFYKAFNLPQCGVIRHIHQINPAVQTIVVPASHSIRVIFLEIRRYLADKVVDGPVVECGNALLCGLLGSISDYSFAGGLACRVLHLVDVLQAADRVEAALDLFLVPVVWQSVDHDLGRKRSIQSIHQHGVADNHRLQSRSLLHPQKSTGNHFFNY